MIDVTADAKSAGSWRDGSWVDTGMLDFGSLPDGANVAVVTLLGSLCPVTRGHVQGFLEARRIFLAEVPRPRQLEDFHGVLGFISLNGDEHVSDKLRKQGHQSLTWLQRKSLVEMATEDYPWLQHEDYQGLELGRLREAWPTLNFIHFIMNGADDVAKYQKYRYSSARYRYITMGRRGYTETVVRGMEAANVDPEAGYFIMGPELPDISSTDVRKALSSRNAAALESLLSPRVAEWCMTHYGS